MSLQLLQQCFAQPPYCACMRPYPAHRPWRLLPWPGGQHPHQPWNGEPGQPPHGVHCTSRGACRTCCGHCRPPAPDPARALLPRPMRSHASRKPVRTTKCVQLQLTPTECHEAGPQQARRGAAARGRKAAHQPLPRVARRRRRVCGRQRRQLPFLWCAGPGRPPAPSRIAPLRGAGHHSCHQNAWPLPRPRCAGYAAQSLLSAIGCVQFVSNVAFASLVLKERASRAVLAATGCIVAGCVLLVSFGDHSSAVCSLCGWHPQRAHLCMHARTQWWGPHQLSRAECGTPDSSQQ